jgi:hypothetical protein
MALLQQAGRSMIVVQKTIFCEETLQHLCPKSMTHPYSLSAKLGLFPAMFAFMQGDSPPRKKVFVPTTHPKKGRATERETDPAAPSGKARSFQVPVWPLAAELPVRSISSAFSDSFNFFHII